MDIVAELEIDRLRVENEKLKSEIKKRKGKFLLAI